MLNLLKFLGKLILPCIIPYIFLSVVQGFQFNILNWHEIAIRVYVSMTTIFLILTFWYIVSED
jgi:hypothetical protein